MIEPVDGGGDDAADEDEADDPRHDGVVVVGEVVALLLPHATPLLPAASMYHQQSQRVKRSK